MASLREAVRPSGRPRSAGEGAKCSAHGQRAGLGNFNPQNPRSKVCAQRSLPGRGWPVRRHGGERRLGSIRASRPPTPSDALEDGAALT